MHQAALIIAWLILFSTLALILSEKLPRSVAAMLGGFLMVAAGLIFGFYNEHEAVLSIDFNTLGLLLGMMILVALLETTGFFQFIAIKAAQKSRGKPVLLLLCWAGLPRSSPCSWIMSQQSS
ncbi:MAG TPA: SLC13 family permease [Anaerolineaceae bacterium]|nr:SLC13 family permease [Anaerolineaceae bacterium]